MNNKLLINIIMIMIIILILLPHITFAGYNLKELSVKSTDSTTLVIFNFDKLPKFEYKKKNKEITFLFHNTYTQVTNWPSEIEATILNSIEASMENNNLVIKLTTNKPFSYNTKTQKNKLILEIQEIKIKQENLSSKYRFEVPSPPSEIIVPFTKKKYKGSLISIDVQNADIQNILRLIAKIGGFNLVISEDVKGKITLSLHNVPWDQALDIILSSKGLGMAKIGNVIRVAPLMTLKEETEQLAQIKEAISKEETAAPLVTAYLQVNYAKASDLVKQIQTLLTERGSVTYDERTNKIILKDVPAVVEKAKYVISQLDEPVKQVLIEARIVQIINRFQYQLGINWSGGAWRSSTHTFTGIGQVQAQPETINIGEQPQISFSLNGTAPSISNAIVDLGIGGTGFGSLGLMIGRVAGNSAMLLDLQLNTLEEKGLARIISTPHIVTMDHLPAEIKQGDRIPYRRYTPEGLISTEFIDAGLTLKVTPHITPDNRITLEIEAEKSEPDFSRTVDGVPTIITRSAKSKILIENGETIVIGGIINENLTEEHNRVPGFAELPIIGKLFKSKSYSNEKQELLIFITARIIASDIKGIDY